MRRSNGMRPQDVIVLLKIATFKEKNWYAKEIASSTKISAGEVSESLTRSALAGLLSVDKKTLMKNSFLEFLEFGLRYVFPVLPGGVTRGIPTAHSTPLLSKIIVSDEVFVWAFAEGNSRGASIEPLHPKLPEACLTDTKLYQLAALADCLRFGKVRERKLAIEELKKRILQNE